MTVSDELSDTDLEAVAGGKGDVINDIVDAVEDAVDTVGNAVGGAVGNAGNAIGNAVGGFVGNTINLGKGMVVGKDSLPAFGKEFYNDPGAFLKKYFLV
jgi:hypothetical protein